MTGRFMGRTVLVTGGAGFLGSSLVHALLAEGASVRILDAMVPEGGANRANLLGAETATLVVGDLRDVDLVPLCRAVDVVFNLAGQTSHIGSVQNPDADLAINAGAQLRLIRALREVAPTAIVVHASTRQMYGTPRHLPVAEDHPIDPPDPNGISKWAGERYWMLEHRLHGRAVIALRLTNCYGPRLRVRDAKQMFLGFWIRCALEARPFEVWGGEQTRDLAHADDVVEAFLLAALTQAAWGRVFNLGGALPASLREIAETLVAHAPGAGFEIRPFPADRARIDIGSYHADDSAFREATSWEPRVGLRDGIASTLDWYRERLSLYVGEA